MNRRNFTYFFVLHLCFVLFLSAVAMQAELRRVHCDRGQCACEEGETSEDSAVRIQPHVAWAVTNEPEVDSTEDVAATPDLLQPVQVLDVLDVAPKLSPPAFA